jgi:putative endonuclease
MIQTDGGKLYTGITTDVGRRFKEHCSVNNHGKFIRGSKGAKFFRSDPASKVVFKECCEGRSGASQREAAIKQLTREKKLQLIVDSDGLN